MEQLVGVLVEDHLLTRVPDGHAIWSRERQPAEAETVRTLVVDHVVRRTSAGIDGDAARVAAGHVLEDHDEAVIDVLRPTEADRRRDDIAILVLVLAIAPAWTEVLAGMITMESKEEWLRRIEHHRLARSRRESTEVVRAEIDDERGRAVRFLPCRDAIGAEAFLAILDAAGGVQLGVEARELVAGRRAEIEPVLLVLPPDRVTAAVVVGSTDDLERAVRLGLVAAEDTLLAPVVEAIGVEAHFLDLADRDLEAFVVGPEPPHLALLVVRTDVVAIARKGDGTSEGGWRTEVRPGLALVLIDMSMRQQGRPIQATNDAVGTTDAEVVLLAFDKAVIAIVVDTALVADVTGSQPLREEIFLLDPIQEIDDRIGRRSLSCQSLPASRKGLVVLVALPRLVDSLAILEKRIVLRLHRLGHGHHRQEHGRDGHQKIFPLHGELLRLDARWWPRRPIEKRDSYC